MDAIILAGGIGQRAKLNYPKQLFRLGGKPILIHILEIFSSLDEIDNIIVTIPYELEKFEKLLSDYNIKAKCILGGKNRQESTYKALQLCKTDRVIIHEGARPFINKNFIKRLIYYTGDGIIPFKISSDTIFSYEDFMYKNRNYVYNVQLPQVFNREKLLESHELHLGENFSDDSSLLYTHESSNLVFVDGLEQNIKITTPLDVKIAEVLYEECRNSGWWK